MQHTLSVTSAGQSKPITVVDDAVGTFCANFPPCYLMKYHTSINLGVWMLLLRKNS